jgi:hypothetical protein
MYGMESSIWNRSQNGAKNNAKFENSWKRPNTKFVSKTSDGSTQIFSDIFNKLTQEAATPDWLMAGVKLLIPKKNTEKSKTYRPITCLSTI